MKNRKANLVPALVGAIGMAVVIFFTAQSTQERVTLTTSAFWRQMLTNENGTAFLSMLTTNGTNNFSYESLVGGLNQANQFLATDSNTNVISTVNGGSLTNLTIRYPTNAIPANGVLTIGDQWYTTNLNVDVTYPAPNIGSSNVAYYGSTVFEATNSDSAPHKATFTGVVGPFGVTPAVLWCTNGHLTKIILDYANPYTNAWKLDF